MPYHKTLKKIPYQETLSRIIKRCLIMSNKVPYQKKTYQESKKGALSRNLKKSLKRHLIKNLHKILHKNLIKNLK